MGVEKLWELLTFCCKKVIQGLQNWVPLTGGDIVEPYWKLGERWQKFPDY
jgi:hypothetical protein